MENIKAYYNEVNAKNVEKSYAFQLQEDAKYISIAYRLGAFMKTYMEQDEAKKAQLKDKAISEIDATYEKFNQELETEMLTQMIGLYQKKGKSKCSL